MAKIIQIPPPTRGVVRALALENQPPDTLIDSLDVLPRDWKTGYERLAVRPGYSDLGQDSTNLIASLNVAPAETYDRLLLTATGGTLYEWDGVTNAAVTMNGNTITTGATVHAAPYLQELFIAKHSGTNLRYTSGQVQTWTATTDGTVPTNCTLICEWANRIVMSGQPSTPHVWYMSRIGDPYSWLFAADDAASPVAATDIEGGQISEPITALIPHNRDCIIFGTANSMTVLRGNPAPGGGGHMERISYVSGPVNSCAWCRTPDDWTYMLTRDGLYKMPPGCGSTPIPASNQIPASLKGINGIDTKAYLAYDVRFRLIHIYLEGDVDEAWYYDLTNEGFWPQTLPGTGILAIGRFDPLETATASGVLVGTAQGIMRLNSGTALGTGAAYAKFLTHLAPLGLKQQIQRAVVKFGSNTNDAAVVAMYGAESAEAVIAAPASRRSTITATELANNHMTWTPRVGGKDLLLTITQADNTKHWSFEGAALYPIPFGKER